jgi:MFS family permease
VTRKKSPVRVLIALSLASSTYSVSQTMLVPSLPTIQRELGVSLGAVTTLVSVFFVTGAVTSGVTGRLADMYGKRRLLLIQMAVFAGGALLGAVANNLALMIAGRALMGTAIGLFPIAFAIIRDELPAERVPGGIALVSAIVAFGAALGLGVGGIITDHLGYSWIFWAPFIAALVAMAFVWLFVPESSTTYPGRIDLVGAGLLAVAIGAPLAAITQVPSWGWFGDWTLLCFATGLVFLAAFVRHERRDPNPLVHLPTLMLPEVRGTNLATFFVGFGLFGMGAIFTQFVQAPKSTGFGYGANATQAGLFLVPGCLLVVVVAPWTGKLCIRIGAKFALALATFSACVSMVGLVAAHEGAFDLFLWPTILMVASGIAFAAMPLLILENVPADRRAQSTAINAIVRTIGSSIGTQLAATVVALQITAGELHEKGFEHAFLLQAAGLGVATLVALSLPRSAPQTAVVATEAASS